MLWKNLGCVTPVFRKAVFLVPLLAPVVGGFPDCKYYSVESYPKIR